MTEKERGGGGKLRNVPIGKQNAKDCIIKRQETQAAITTPMAV